MTDFRPPTRADADTIVAMLLECDRVDHGAPDYDLEALYEEWDHPDVDVERDAFITDGAYGLLLGRDARAWVHPARRGQGLEEALLERLETRARERGDEWLERQVPRRGDVERAVTEARGWHFVRAYADLRLPDTAVDALPSGGTRPYDEARDEAAAQSLIERAFADGAGRVDSIETLRSRNPDTTLWFVADAPDGSLAGAIRSELRPTGFIEGYIRQIAVEPEHRGQGLAGRLIGAAARELVTRGSVAIRLHVRSSNPDALRVYERLGFTGGWHVDGYRLDLK
jgi:ribosomal protein S18 acetylase RimI-like enzyme